MTEPLKGKLVWQGEGERRVRRVVYPTKKGESPPTPFDAAQLHPKLRGTTDDSVEIELELLAGKPARLRPVGETWGTPPRSATPVPPAASPAPVAVSRPAAVAPVPVKPSVPTGDFHHPYNFVPALDRAHVTGELGDLPPVGHAAYHADRISGTIEFTITTTTPLLLPDASKATTTEDGHKTYPLRVDAAGRPLLAVPSLKGMLRAAYEAATNSRLGVFVGHDRALGYRSAARDGLKLVPVRVTDDAKSVELLPGTAQINPMTGPEGPLYAAWLPRYDRQTGNVAEWAVRWGRELSPHGQPVRAWLELFRKGPLQYWRVRKLAPHGQQLGKAPSRSTPRGQHLPVPNAEMIEVGGFVFASGRNIDTKHDERLFFSTRPQNLTLLLSDEVRRAWHDLIADYRAIHAEEIKAEKTRPPAPANSVWSRHVIAADDVTKLQPGDLCYAAIAKHPTARGLLLRALFPVAISRATYPAAPLELLPESVRPALSTAKLSPAERVFGCVTADGAYRGHLRLGPLTCETADAAERLDPPLPLAILGQPKPSQARFYVGTDKGNAQPSRILDRDQTGYRAPKKLRGRKVYPHHGERPADYWQPSADATRDYRRPSSERDTQNRSVAGWVKPGTVFRGTLHVENLSPVELGALLWLLRWSAGLYHRLGGGKPLGFGSVRVEIVGHELRTGSGWRAFYETFAELGSSNFNLEVVVKAYRQAVEQAYGATFEQVPFIAALLAAARGPTDGKPTHYPRLTADSTEPGYAWFVANERAARQTLPDLASGAGLSYLPDDVP